MTKNVNYQCNKTDVTDAVAKRAISKSEKLRNLCMNPDIICGHKQGGHIMMQIKDGEMAES